MSFDTSYPNRKDWRRPYHDCQSFDRSCRPHGGDPWVANGRLHKHRKRELSATEQIREAH